jgi:hypothetical protein
MSASPSKSPVFKPTLAAAKREFRAQHPNLRTNGWDERDYELWSALQCLPSYGLIAGGDGSDRMVSRKAVEKLLRIAAEKRFEEEWKTGGRP